MILSSNNGSNNEIGVYVFLAIVAVVFFFIIFLVIFNSIKNNRVLSASPYIKEINEINKRFSFQTLSKTSETKTFYLSSKRAFDNFDFYKKRSEFIKEKTFYYKQIIQIIDYNVSTFAEYKKELSRLKITNDESLAKANKMSLKSFRKREVKLGSKLVKYPQMSYSLRIKWEYTSPAGRNHYSRHRDSTFKEIKEVYQQFTITVKVKTHNSNTNSSNAYTHPKSQSFNRVYTNDDIEDAKD